MKHRKESFRRKLNKQHTTLMIKHCILDDKHGIKINVKLYICIKERTSDFPNIFSYDSSTGDYLVTILLLCKNIDKFIIHDKKTNVL